jgi:hypothetical protein
MSGVLESSSRFRFAGKWSRHYAKPGLYAWSVIRGLTGSGHIMDVAFAKTGGADSQEPAVSLHFGQRCVASVAHGRPKASK